MLERMAGFASRHPRRVVAVTVVAAVAAGGFGGNVAQNLLPYNSEDPGTGSAKANERLRKATGLDPETGLLAVVRTPQGPRAAESRSRVGRVAKAIGDDRHVGRVSTFYNSRDRALVSRDGRSQIVAVRFKDVGDDDQQDAAERLSEELNSRDVQLGG